MTAQPDPKSIDNEIAEGDYLGHAIVFVKKHYRRIMFAGAALAIGYAAYVWFTLPKPDPARSRLAPGNEVVIHNDDGNVVKAARASDDYTNVTIKSIATVVSDAIPDPGDQPDAKPGVGLGETRPVKIRVIDGPSAGEFLTIGRGNLRPR